MPDPIDRAFAFIVESPEGEDIGVMAIMTKGGPMVLSGTDMSRVPKLIPAACAVARKTRTKVRVVEFITAQVIGRIDEHGAFHPTPQVARIKPD